MKNTRLEQKITTTNNSKIPQYQEKIKKYIIQLYNKLNIFFSNDKKQNYKNIKNVVLILFFYVCIFHNSIQSIIPIIRYFDEILALISVVYFFNKIIIKNEKILTKHDWGFIFCIGMVVVIGFTANCIFQYQLPIVAILDAVAITKFFLIYLLFKYLNVKTIIEDNKELFNKNISVFVKYGLILTALNYLYSTFPAEIKYGLLSNRLIFEHPTYLSAATSFLLIFYLYIENKPDLKKILCMLFIIVSTLRSKAIVFAVLFSALYFLKMVKNKKINIKTIICGVILATIIALPSIYYYFIKIDDSARSQLLKTSFYIANDHFPIGSGFATFGSQYSGIEYSPLYSKYNIENTYGLIEGDTQFVSDSFWPMILGQFGYLGLIAYCLSIMLLIYETVKKCKNNPKSQVAMYCAIIYLLISSTAESAFANALAFPFAIILGINNYDKRPLTKENIYDT